MRARSLIVWLLALAPLSQANAGAWLQPAGHGQFISQASYYTSDAFFDREGQKTPQPRFSKIEFQPYVEYGALENLTLGATGYTQYVTQSGNKNIGLADPEIFARTKIWNDDTSLISIQPLIKFSSHFAKDLPPRGGSQSTDLELSILYGRNLNILSKNDYLDTRAGYRHRANRLNDQWRGDIALGIEFMPNWYVTPAIRSIIATKISNTIPFSENGDQDYDLIKVELGVNYRINSQQYAGVSVFNHVYGTQTGNGNGVIASFTQGF